jgi:voltage-gated potassium channel
VISGETGGSGAPGVEEKHVMDERSERLQRRFEVPVTIAALLVIPVMVLRSTGPGEPWSTVGDIGDWLIWLTFVVEVATMLTVVPSRWTWVRSHWLDVAIVVLTPPFSVAVLQSVQVLRLLRLVRLLRVLHLLRGIFTIQGVQYAAFLAFLTLLAGAQAFASAEDVPLSDGLYWGISTMTSVGYGDFTPETGVGKVVAATLMVVGLGFAAVITGALAQRFIVTEDTVTEADRRTLGEEQETHAKPDELSARMDRLETLIRAGAR